MLVNWLVRWLVGRLTDFFICIYSWKEAEKQQEHTPPNHPALMTLIAITTRHIHIFRNVLMACIMMCIRSSKEFKCTKSTGTVYSVHTQDRRQKVAHISIHTVLYSSNRQYCYPKKSRVKRLLMKKIKQHTKETSCSALIGCFLPSGGQTLCFSVAWTLLWTPFTFNVPRTFNTADCVCLSDIPNISSQYWIIDFQAWGILLNEIEVGEVMFVRNLQVSAAICCLPHHVCTLFHFFFTPCPFFFSSVPSQPPPYSLYASFPSLVWTSSKLSRISFIPSLPTT